MRIIRNIIILILIIVAIAIACFVGYDIYEDRQNKLVLNGTVPVYADWHPYPTKEQKPIFILSAQATVKVKRIRYGKDYMAVRVETQAGKSGWIFTGFSFVSKKVTTRNP